MRCRNESPGRSDGTVEKQLVQTLNNAGLTFRKVRDTYIISDTKTPLGKPRATTDGASLLDVPTLPTNPAPGPVMVSRDVIMQTAPAPRPIRGTVRDETGQPLPGVSLVLKGTNRGTVTTGEGMFQLDIPDEVSSPVLVASFVGYLTQGYCSHSLW